MDLKKDKITANMKLSRYNLPKVYYKCILLLLLFSNCRDENLHYDITIKNNSSESICATFNQIFPDTTIDCRIIIINLGPQQEYQLSLRNGWEYEFKRKNVLQIFVFDGNICKNEACDTIKKYNKILKRYQLTVNDMEQMNWIVAYP